MPLVYGFLLSHGQAGSNPKVRFADHTTRTDWFHEPGTEDRKKEETDPSD
jgi:hypothetical protein